MSGNCSMFGKLFKVDLDFKINKLWNTVWVILPWEEKNDFWYFKNAFIARTHVHTIRIKTRNEKFLKTEISTYFEMFATNMFVIRACSGQAVSSELQENISWQIFLTVIFYKFVAKWILVTILIMKLCPKVNSSRSNISPLLTSLDDVIQK